MLTGGDAGTRGVAARRLLALALAVAIAALAAGCGGDDTSSTEEWANGVCSAFSDWRDSVASAGESLRAGPTTKDDLENAVDDLESSTDDFADELRGLDKPDTQDGQKAKETLEGLADDVDQNKEDIQSAVSAVSDVQGVIAAVTSIATTVQTMGRQLQQTFTELEQLDPGSELSDAFENADACKSLSG